MGASRLQLTAVMTEILCCSQLTTSDRSTTQSAVSCSRRFYHPVICLSWPGRVDREWTPTDHVCPHCRHLNVFLPRDAKRKRVLCCRPVFVRLSVCLSVTFMTLCCMQTAQTSFSAGSAIILVFDPSTGTQFQGEPLLRGRKTQDGGKILRFSTELKSPFISETVRDRPLVAVER